MDPSVPINLGTSDQSAMDKEEQLLVFHHHSWYPGMISYFNKQIERGKQTIFYLKIKSSRSHFTNNFLISPKWHSLCKIKMLHDKINIFLPPIRTQIMSPSNFLKCSSISICVTLCFANINIRRIACKLQDHIYKLLRICLNISANFISAFLPFIWYFFSQSTFSKVGENMLHHKKQGTNNPMLCWKFCMGLIHKYTSRINTTFI